MSENGKLLLDDNSTEVVSRLMGRIVHDFNNPLAAIIGFAELLKNPRLSPEKQERYRTRIYDQAQKLSQLVENMSYFSSLPTPQVSRMSLVRVVSDVYALRQGGFMSVRVDLRYDRPDEDVVVMGESAALVRILHSLLNNAEQAFKENPTLEARSALISCRIEGDWGLVDVIDSGPGVPQEIEELIFAPFYSTRRSGGLGLGLTVSRSLTERMGGTLELVRDDSAQLSGALFRLRLPVPEA